MATDIQLRIAATLGLDVSADSETVAAGRILDEVAEAVGLRQGKIPATGNQLEFGSELGLDLTGDSLRVASDKIGDELHRRNLEALKRLDLKSGDHVLKRSIFEVNGVPHEVLREFVVSSIQSNTRVFFKGPNCQGAWPTQLERVEAQG